MSVPNYMAIHLIHIKIFHPETPANLLKVRRVFLPLSFATIMAKIIHVVY